MRCHSQFISPPLPLGCFGTMFAGVYPLGVQRPLNHVSQLSRRFPSQLKAGSVAPSGASATASTDAAPSA